MIKWINCAHYKILCSFSGFTLSIRVNLMDVVYYYWTMYGIILCVFLSSHHSTNTITVAMSRSNSASWTVFFCCVVYVNALLTWVAIWMIPFWGPYAWELNQKPKHCKNFEFWHCTDTLNTNNVFVLS